MRRARGGILLDVLVGIALEALYDAARNQLHVALGRGKVDKGTAIYQWRTGYAHVALTQSGVEKHPYVVAQLSATHDGVVTEQHTLATEHGLVGYQFHLGHQRAHGLVRWRKGAGPGGRVLDYAALVGYAHARSVAHGHARA